MGHWDGYAGNRNNYWFYREPGGKFVFIPWGVDGTFHLEEDPNVFDHVTEPPPSVLALAAIANRLYNDAEWQAKYVAALKELLDTAWDEEELLALVDIHGGHRGGTFVARWRGRPRRRMRSG